MIPTMNVALFVGETLPAIGRNDNLHYGIKNYYTQQRIYTMLPCKRKGTLEAVRNACQPVESSVRTRPGEHSTYSRHVVQNAKLIFYYRRGIRKSVYETRYM